MRALVVVAGFAVAGCSLVGPDIVDPPHSYVPPNQPSLEAQLRGIAKAAKDEKLSGALEISDLRTSDFGPGRYMMCVRGARASGPVDFYAVFFQDDEYKGVRLSVITEHCEHQSFRPSGPLPPVVEVGADASPTPTPTPTPH